MLKNTTVYITWSGFLGTVLMASNTEAPQIISQGPKKAPTQEDQKPRQQLSWFSTTILLFFISCVAIFIRLHAVQVYGRVIHEFDPWFNYRATEYLVKNGLAKFLTWFDDQSWYPIGRPVGTTIYPGLMMTSAYIHHFLNWAGFPISVNDVCVFVPAGFGALTTLFTFGLADEILRIRSAAVFSAAIMAIIPAHTMRSVAGGYDNESVAVAAIVSTFYFWLRSFRTPSSWPVAILTGLSYIYMAAAWGGYTFVINMIGVHAGFLLFAGRFTPKLHRAYTIFFVIGTAGAMQIPIVGWTPLTSMEQLGPLGVFFVMQLFWILNFFKGKMGKEQFHQFRLIALSICVLIGAAVFSYLSSLGYIGSFSTRVRSLFIPHTRTGNPLVDSVAEHAATPPEFYIRYFHIVCWIGPLGFYNLYGGGLGRPDHAYFGILFTIISGYFSLKMVRLILLLSPAASICAGNAVFLMIEWAMQQFQNTPTQETPEESTTKQLPPRGKPVVKSPKKTPTPAKTAKQTNKNSDDIWESQEFAPMRKVLAVVVLLLLVLSAVRFTADSFTMATYLSEPQIIMRSYNQQTGESTIYDDFRQSYWWLRDNTPEDARVMAWWDYGYQINGVANRTTIADGNTWNHEHIALLGRCLVSGEKEAHQIARHLADYVLVWTTRFVGSFRDDLAKMPHMARIAGSVYPDIDAQGYAMERDGSNPSRLTERSLLYKLSYYKMKEGAANLTFFENVYNSPHNMVRIYKVKDVAKRHPFGSYAPELKLGQFRQNN